MERRKTAGVQDKWIHFKESVTGCVRDVYGVRQRGKRGGMRNVGAYT